MLAEKWNRRNEARLFWLVKWGGYEAQQCNKESISLVWLHGVVVVSVHFLLSVVYKAPLSTTNCTSIVSLGAEISASIHIRSESHAHRGSEIPDLFNNSAKHFLVVSEMS